MQLIPFQKKKKNLTDHELLSCFLKSHDSDYLGELFGRYMHLVYGVCLKYLKDRETAKDAVIQIYEKLQNEISRHEIHNFKSWLYTVSKNYCLMELRKQGNMRMVYSDDKNQTYFMENETELHPVDVEGIPDKDLDDCIEKLRQEQKDCITHFYFNDKCYREIAGLLEMDEKGVKSHIQNAKRNLKICLEKKK